LFCSLTEAFNPFATENLNQADAEVPPHQKKKKDDRSVTKP